MTIKCSKVTKNEKVYFYLLFFRWLLVITYVISLLNRTQTRFLLQRITTISFPVSQQECEEWPMRWLSVSHPALIWPFLGIPRSSSTLISSLCHPLPPLFFSFWHIFLSKCFLLFTLLTTLPQIIATYELLQWRERTAQYFIGQATASFQKSQRSTSDSQNQPHRHPLLQDQQEGPHQSSFQNSCLVELDSFPIGIKRQSVSTLHVFTCAAGKLQVCACA